MSYQVRIKVNNKEVTEYYLSRESAELAARRISKINAAAQVRIIKAGL